MTDDEVRMAIHAGGKVYLSDLLTLFNLMVEEGVQVVSATTPLPRIPGRRAPFLIDLQGAETALEAAIARFRQRSDAWAEKLPPVPL